MKTRSCIQLTPFLVQLQETSSNNRINNFGRLPKQQIILPILEYLKMRCQVAKVANDHQTNLFKHLLHSNQLLINHKTLCNSENQLNKADRTLCPMLQSRLCLQIKIEFKILKQLLKRHIRMHSKTSMHRQMSRE